LNVSKIDQTPGAKQICPSIEYARRTSPAHRFLQVVLLGTTLTVAVATVPTPAKSADDHPQRYYDKEHNDDHEWNDREDRVYRKWTDEKHHAKREFAKLKAKEQKEYWKWRHGHPDHDKGE
jgi:hypothetical protein